jgi:hypothetical protein
MILISYSLILMELFKINLVISVRLFQNICNLFIVVFVLALVL